MLCTDVDGSGGSFGLFAFILEYLDYESVLNVAASCRVWYQAIIHIPTDSFLRRSDHFLRYYEDLFARRWPKEYAFLSHDGYYHDYFFFFYHRWFGFLDGFQLYIPILDHWDRKLLCKASATNPLHTNDEFEAYRDHFSDNIETKFAFRGKKKPHLFPSATATFDPRFLPNIHSEKIFENQELVDQIMEALVGWIYSCRHAKRGIKKIQEEIEAPMVLPAEFETSMREEMDMIYFEMLSNEVTVWMDIRDRLSYLNDQVILSIFLSTMLTHSLASLVRSLAVLRIDAIRSMVFDCFEDERF